MGHAGGAGPHPRAGRGRAVHRHEDPARVRHRRTGGRVREASRRRLPQEQVRREGAHARGVPLAGIRVRARVPRPREVADRAHGVDREGGGEPAARAHDRAERRLDGSDALRPAGGRRGAIQCEVGLEQRGARAGQLHRERARDDTEAAGVQGRAQRLPRRGREPEDGRAAATDRGRAEPLAHRARVARVPAEVGVGAMDEKGIAWYSRRDFMKAGFVFGVGAPALAAGYAAVPDVFARAIFDAKQAGVVNDRVLVMLQLGGGNDGLQTVIPLGNGRFRDLRPTLGAVADKALPITNELGLNEKLAGIKKLYDQGKVAIVQGVGYPQPSFSHFDSIRVWETADPARRQQDGWLGKAIAANYDSAGHPLVGCACGTTSVPGALRDLQATLTVIQDQNSFKFQGGDNVEQVMGALYSGTPGIYGALFDTAMTTVRDTVAQLRTSASKYTPKAAYSDKQQLVYSSKNQLAAALQLAAELIVTGTGVKILHVTLGGFDTHYTELNRHDALMAYLDSAVSAFHDDLVAYGMADRVLIATWSEFGRRPKENASGGTDHGTASPVIVVGDGVKGGLYGETPALAKLDQLGNLSYGVDFRAVYQEILTSHLGVDGKEILGQSFERVPFVKAPA